LGKNLAGDDDESDVLERIAIRALAADRRAVLVAED
jgi:hypothetical protein